MDGTRQGVIMTGPVVVVAGVRHDDDVRFTRRPPPRRDKPFDNAAEAGRR